MSPRRPSVLLVAHSVDPRGGGMERIHARLLADQSQEVDFEVIAGETGGTLPPGVTLRRVWIPRRPAPLRYLAFSLQASLKVARHRRGRLVHTCGAVVVNKVDVITVHLLSQAVVDAAGGRFAPASAPWARRLNTGLMRRLAIWAERHSYRPGRVRVLAAVSGSVADELGRFAPGIPVEVTPNGVDLDRFHPDPAAGAALRATLGLEGATIALFVGGDFEHKGLGLAIEALVDAPTVDLVVVGRGDKDRFGRRATELGVRERVHFVGERQDIASFDAMADLFVCASVYETGPLALLEAAACGVPVISTPVGVAPEVIGRGDERPAGILVERSAEAIGAAMARVAEDEDERRAMGEEARRRAEERSWEQTVSSVAALYEELAGDAR